MLTTPPPSLPISPTSTPTYGLSWLQDHNAACLAAHKPCVLEELGVNRNTALDVAATMTEYQQYILSSGDAPAIRGSMDWSSMYVRDECPGKEDPYAICEADAWYGEVVREFAVKMGEKA